MNDAAYKQGALLLSKGIPVIAVWGVNDDGSCACHRGASCSATGKHPVGNSWQNSLIHDEDELYEKVAEADGPRNIGIPFGPHTGVVDIEFDGEEGRLTAERLGLSGVGTASFQSSRSRHYLFRHHPRLPNKAVMPNVKGLEIRIGGGERGAHSVAPGSRHKSGVEYAWVPGASIEDCDVLPMPENLLNLILTAEQSGSSEAANLALVPLVESGGRHDAVRKTAFCLAASLKEGNDPRFNMNLVYQLVSDMNQFKCDPPLDDGEVRELVRSAFPAVAAFRKQEPNAELLDLADKFSDRHERVKSGEISPRHLTEADGHLTLMNCGIDVDDGEWNPGSWQLEIVASEPKIYRIRFDYFDRPAGETRRASVDFDSVDFNKPEIVAARIMNETSVLDMNPQPGLFAEVWNGKRGKRGEDGVIGLKSKLLMQSVVVQPAAGTTPWIMAGRAVVHALTNANPEQQVDSPEHSGSPTWVEGFGLTFVWGKLIEEAAGMSRAASDDKMVTAFRKAVDRALGDDLTTSVRFTVQGHRRRYQVITEENLGRLVEFVESLS